MAEWLQKKDPGSPAGKKYLASQETSSLTTQATKEVETYETKGADAPPPLRLQNPKTGLVIYPKMEKDANDNWQISNLDAVRVLLGTQNEPSGPSRTERSVQKTSNTTLSASDGKMDGRVLALQLARAALEKDPNNLAAKRELALAMAYAKEHPEEAPFLEPYLSEGEVEQNQFERRLREILNEHPDVDQERAARLLRSLPPQATNEQIALLSKLGQDVADRMAIENMPITEKKHTKALQNSTKESITTSTPSTSRKVQCWRDAQILARRIQARDPGSPVGRRYLASEEKTSLNPQATNEAEPFKPKGEDAPPPTLRLRNPQNGLVIYPKMEKDADGNWQISNPETIGAFLGTAQPEKYSHRSFAMTPSCSEGAEALEKAQDWPGLLTHSRRWTQAEPSDPISWKNLGLAYIKLGYLEESIEAYREAVRLKPDYADAWFALGSTNQIFRRYAEAVEAYMEAVRLKPDYADAWFGLGVTYRKLFRYPDAIEAYRETVRLKPDHRNAWYFLALAYADSGNRSGALEAVQQVRRLDPQEADDLINIFKVDRGTKERDKKEEGKQPDTDEVQSEIRQKNTRVIFNKNINSAHNLNNDNLSDKQNGNMLTQKESLWHTAFQGLVIIVIGIIILLFAIIIVPGPGLIIAVLWGIIVGVVWLCHFVGKWFSSKK